MASQFLLYQNSNTWLNQHKLRRLSRARGWAAGVRIELQGGDKDAATVSSTFPLRGWIAATSLLASTTPL